MTNNKTLPDGRASQAAPQKEGALVVRIPSQTIPAALWMLGGLAFLSTLVLLFIAAQLPLARPVTQLLSWVFALDGAHNPMWYITRAAGLTSYVLTWLSVVWGLALPSKIFDRLLNGAFTYDFHEFLSLAAIGFMLLHMGVLLFDSYMPYSLAQILVPFLSSYRPLWVGLGVIAFHLTLLVTLTFYIRKRIGMKTFRAIHYFSLLAYLGATAHAFLAGTDSSLFSMIGLYATTFLVVVFLTVYWLVLGLIKRGERKLALR